jgi:hypothetical protein
MPNHGLVSSASPAAQRPAPGSGNGAGGALVLGARSCLPAIPTAPIYHAWGGPGVKRAAPGRFRTRRFGQRQCAELGLASGECRVALHTSYPVGPGRPVPTFLMHAVKKTTRMGPIYKVGCCVGPRGYAHNPSPVGAAMAALAAVSGKLGSSARRQITLFEHGALGSSKRRRDNVSVGIVKFPSNRECAIASIWSRERMSKGSPTFRAARLAIGQRMRPAQRRGSAPRPRGSLIP